MPNAVCASLFIAHCSLFIKIPTPDRKTGDPFANLGNKFRQWFKLIGLKSYINKDIVIGINIGTGFDNTVFLNTENMKC